LFWGENGLGAAPFRLIFYVNLSGHMEVNDTVHAALSSPDRDDCHSKLHYMMYYRVLKGHSRVFFQASFVRQNKFCHGFDVPSGDLRQGHEAILRTCALVAIF